MATLGIQLSVQTLAKYYSSDKVNKDINEHYPFVSLVKDAQKFASTTEYKSNPDYSMQRNKIVATYNSIAKLPTSIKNLAQVKQLDKKSTAILVDELSSINLITIGLEKALPTQPITISAKKKEKPQTEQQHPHGLIGNYDDDEIFKMEDII